jgi:hypothetical protein
MEDWDEDQIGGILTEENMRGPENIFYVDLPVTYTEKLCRSLYVGLLKDLSQVLCWP